MQKKQRWLTTTLFVVLTIGLGLVLVQWRLEPATVGTGDVLACLFLWGLCAVICFFQRRRGTWKGFDCVSRCFGGEDLRRHMEKEQFVKLSKYISASPNWLCFRGQYVPKNFVVGAYAVGSMDQSDTLHLALITGNTCHGFVYDRDTLTELKRLKELLPHADILSGGALFLDWWGGHREELARQYARWCEEGRDFWPLVYRYHRVAGWEKKTDDGKIDDSEEYFREYPEERLPG